MTALVGRTRTLPRIPLNTLAISFGIAGLATLWSTATAALELPVIIPVVLWCGAGVAWVWTIVAHLTRGAHSSDTLRSQLEHPAQGPIAAIVPAVGMLLGAQLHLIWPVGGTMLALASLIVATLFAGWLLAFWHKGRLNPEAFHGAYLLPTVASPLIASTVSARLDLPLLAMGAFAVGIFFWVVLVTVLLSRLAFFPPLPDPLTPTLAILLAPPAVAGIAWFAMNGVHPDAFSAGMLGLLVLMAVMQLFLIGTYRRLPFSLGFWSFTFPVASATSYGIDWLTIETFDGWQLVAILIAAGATALIAAIGLRSIVLVSTVRRGVRRAEQALRRADDAVALRLHSR
ncbi:transporter [Herbiconiux sp. CPCC 205763]|uniref:Transporter n=1 Tax=Herbiconiux aconitum TaxID=2970913 RepID=A0ABT2GNN7_9MICO|nr:transporter [Herbiconiux aconitum]MCS5717798.1 transporter [Herbiconiux aconitum]